MGHLRKKQNRIESGARFELCHAEICALELDVELARPSPPFDVLYMPIEEAPNGQKIDATPDHPLQRFAPLMNGTIRKPAQPILKH
jgi:hypothetical protein